MSAWIEYVKSYAKEHNMKYNDALKEASKSYKGKKGEANDTKPEKKVRMKKTKN